MPRITVELLRKRSEHNECIISTLEEISLHQEELEKIEVIGTLCRKLRILYLQNNIIEKIEDLTHMKELRYLNLALNNISKIEGLEACEFLEKLDLTVNFVDFDSLEESIDHLKPLRHLRELYMMGNPAQSNWPEGFHEYVIASLPQLRLLDGKEIHRSDRIKALQVFEARQRHVREQAVRVRMEKAHQAALERQSPAQDEELTDDEGEVIEVSSGRATDISEHKKKKKEKPSVLESQEKVPYTPHTRREMYMELAEQKEEEEARRRENQPRERNMEAEHEAALQEVRRQEEKAKDEHSIRQCNEGKWDFRLFDEDLEIILEVDLPRFLDTSLVDVDVHPSYVSMVIKNKLFRLRFPELVHSDQGKAERSKVTGTLRLTLPKAHVTPTQQLHAQLKREEQERLKEQQKTSNTSKTTKNPRTKRIETNTTKLSDEVLVAAEQHVNESNGNSIRVGVVKLRNLKHSGHGQENKSTPKNQKKAAQMTPLVTKKMAVKHECPEVEEDEDIPPLVY
ncbi:hypothetical protein Poli38472_001708 [Pythium oligandrum]|uniref:Dynein axonemal assembly factor 11-like CS domain-containing protein n=1 Tax=Pythium oligandrum TaxID=41045 RepID=A0A8K1CVA7_PYTOL|nr:hypothetical protein Poli38472_001708 [Pythium oligandrum]|eukprot:TMW69552.1 hypothetical protein Poli38472_001708 [Pythium oligandrum]